ncbi:hypothetical protein, partial [Faecalibacterium prausnitzii]|uniref:hypothetical protein n=1 Tax=Faecalibacterium prausnitzii TaxID=853 RepID=UPI003F1D69D6
MGASRASDDTAAAPAPPTSRSGEQHAPPPTPAPGAPPAKGTGVTVCLTGTVVPLADVKDAAVASGVL